MVESKTANVLAGMAVEIQIGLAVSAVYLRRIILAILDRRVDDCYPDRSLALCVEPLLREVECI